VFRAVYKTQDDDDPQRLLSKDNVDQSALMTYAREAADIATRHRLLNLDYAHNHYGQPDVAMFDFTSMYAAENACRVIERQGYRLLVALVGDTLLEVTDITVIMISSLLLYSRFFYRVHPFSVSPSLSVLICPFALGM